MRPERVKRTLHSFEDGDARHHDDELAPAVALEQLADGAQVHVGLARPRFHLDREVRTLVRAVSCALEHKPVVHLEL